MSAAPLTTVTLERAINLASSHPAPTVLVRRVDTLAKWMSGKNATPTAFTCEAAPLNALVTLALADKTQWERVKDHIMKTHEKQSWKGHNPADRTEYMRQYMRQYRADKPVK